MSYPQRTISGVATDVFSTPVPTPSSSTIFSPQPARDYSRPNYLTRRYEIAYLSDSGTVEMTTSLAPAIPEFEEAFSSFARGTVIATTEGPVAIEDLVPGMEALTAEGRKEQIMWIGSMTLFPSRASLGLETAKMTRITTEAFGVGRPTPDLMLGNRARLLLRDARCRSITNAEAAYAPAVSFVDGVSIIEVTPAAPITVYNVVLRRHGSLRAAGLEIESYHPGGAVADRLDAQLSSLFLSLFPHVRSFVEFGPMTFPRMTSFEVEAALLG
ncbi:MAG: Hint domain-containing protein [Paracoccaceae bacterium]|nr:Hint domain-containing protein [Paracoccaceae bacterium]MDH5531377.1 Hint domain-containing protein [Paracoccaceae bacterium]